MLHGRLVGLRARRPGDVPVLHEQLHDDISAHLQAYTAPWRPISDPAAGRFAVREPQDDVAAFSVVETLTGELAGSATLWRIDTHNRNAHLGLALLPAARGRGLGPDVIGVLCGYAFTILGLNRVQLETAADNEAMRKTATRAGFTQEGIQRQANWTAGRFVDDVTFGLLADEWIAPA